MVFVDYWMIDDRDRMDDNIDRPAQYSFFLYWSSYLFQFHEVSSHIEGSILFVVH